MFSTDRLETYQKLAEPVRGPIWIDKDLHVPKLWHRLILSIFGSFECVRQYFNIDYGLTQNTLHTKRAVFAQSGDIRLVKIFNAAVRNLEKAAGRNYRIDEIGEPAAQVSNLTEEEAFTLQNILCRRHYNCADQLTGIDSVLNPEIQTPKNLRLLIQNCPNLAVFNFIGTGISSEHLQVLQENAARVTGLFLSKSTCLSDEDLARLQSFQNLTHFSIYNRKDDKRLPGIILGMIKTNWQRVIVEGVPFTAEQLDQLPRDGSFSAEAHTWKREIGG